MDVLDLRYMQRIRFTLWSIGAWPSHVFKDLPATRLSAISRYGYTSTLFILCCFAIVAQGMYLFKNMGIVDFIDIGQSCLTLLMSIVYAQRALLPIQIAYQEAIEEFSSKFHLIHHRNKTEFSAKMYKKVTKFCEIGVLVQLVQIYLTASMFNLAPVYMNFKAGMFSSEKPMNGTYEHSVYYVLPFDHNNEIGYIIISLYNCYVSYNLANTFLCHDCLICVFVIHIWGHLKILKNNLNYFPRPSIDVNAKTVPLRYSSEESKKVAMKLKEIITHYIMIKEFVAKISDTYNVTLCVYHGFHLIADCVLLLECSTLEIEALTKYGFITVGLYQQLIQLSVMFELITSESDSLADAVYGLPWEYMDNSNRRTVLILLQIVQQSMALKACGMVPVGVQTMLAILKASFSYFLMLKTFANN